MKNVSIETLESRYEKAVFDKMRYLNLYRNNSQEGYPEHWHSVNEIEFIMPIMGEYPVMCDGRKLLLKEQEILMIPHGCTHKLLPVQKYGERIIFVADLGLLYQFKEYKSMFGFRIPLMKIDSSKASLQKKLNAYIMELEQEYYGENKMRTSSIYALVIQIFVTIARELEAEDDQTEGVLLPERLAAVMEFMENHMGEELTQEYVAGLFQYHPEELGELLKRHTGYYYGQYLVNIRINQAEEFLSEHQELGIEEIGRQCGFSSYATFIRVFKEKKGCTPSEYRKNRY